MIYINTNKYMIDRILYNKINENVSKYPVLSIIGPRQSGKTTLVQTMFSEYQYINFEDFELRNFALNDLKGFLNTYNQKTIFDEVQHVPELFSQIQLIVDKTKEKGKFILTGSQNFVLMQKISQSLAGRTAIFTLLPFSNIELQNTEFEETNCYNYILKGFYPPIYDNNLIPTTWFSNYITTYIEKDVRNILNIGNLMQFQALIKICAINIGQTVNFTQIATQIGVSYQTIKSWLSILEASYLIYFLPPYYKNFNKRITKTPKLYFYDTGLVCSLLGIKNIEQIENSVFKGALFENFIITEISKFYYNIGEKPPIYFFRDSNGNEVDLLIENNDKLLAIEIKSSATFNEHFLDKLTYFENLQNNTTTLKYVIYNGKENQFRTNSTILTWNNLAKIFNQLE